jgi:exodeoxyribonuclease VII small subunit
MTKKNDPIASMNFEQAQEALAEVLSQLEDNPTNLEGSVALFEKGRALIDHCQTLLDQAELKVSQLEDNGDIMPMEP